MRSFPKASVLRSGSVIRITFRRPKRPYRELLLLLLELAVFAVVVVVAEVVAVLFDVAEEIVDFGAVFLDLELLLLSPPLPGSAGKLSF